MTADDIYRILAPDGENYVRLTKRDLDRLLQAKYEEGYENGYKDGRSEKSD